MDIIERLFEDLESNNLVRVEDSKKRLSENFALTKESWLVNGMMEYFSQTNSARIVDILVKVQPPHDKFIFDRLAEWVHSPNRNQAITLFGHIVKKHPSWLHKVATHPLFRDILKLLKTETNIIITMNALFCIIILLPIIPTSIPQYLLELFEVFHHLATWNCLNQPRLTDDQLIHLQIGLSTFFQRLYGMYPCNFIKYLTDYVCSDNSAVFSHTIRPLLETVKMHPMLLTSNREQEKNNMRWKEMEPHDVVVECSRFSLDFPTGSSSVTDSIGLISECPYFKIISKHSATATPVSQQLRQSQKNTPAFSSNLSTQFFSPFIDVSRVKEQPQRIENLWSPLVSVMATPPPIGGGAPATPTPLATSYPMPAMSVSGSSGQQQLCNSGSSPPETAVEATPETTPIPMKDSVRTFPVHSTAVRAIWGHSQPSSPMKKDANTNFRFNTDITTFEVPALSSPKIMNFVLERNLYQMHDIGIHADAEVQRTTNVLPSVAITDSAKEDAEVNRINSAVFPPIPPEPGFMEYSPHGNDKNLEHVEQTEIRNPKSCSSTQGDKITVDSSRSNDDEEDEDSTTAEEEQEENKDDTARSPTAAPSRNNDSLKSKLLRSKRSNFAHQKGRVSMSTQTIEQIPQTYQQMFVNLLECGDTNKSSSRIKTDSDLSASAGVASATSPISAELGLPLSVPSRSTPLSPHTLLDQYIETTVKKRDPSVEANTNGIDVYRDQIQLLNLQLQFERHRREVHAERNRRLLGKSRVNASLEMDNEKLYDQKAKLDHDVDELNDLLNKARLARTQQDHKYERECARFQREMQAENDEKKMLRERIEALQRGLVSEQQGKKELTTELASVRAEMFDMRNELSQTQDRAEMGLHYKEELGKLQTEFVLMGELQVRCRDKLEEMEVIRARADEADSIRLAYTEEVKDMKYTLESKSAHLDSAKTRLQELESQLSRRDSMFIEQKRLLKTVKEEYQDRFKSLEEKYKAQKAVILRLEVELLEMFHRSQTVAAVNTNSSSSEADKTNDPVIGSLDHTSPLSISLASSEGLSISLRSNTTEIRNLLPLVTASSSTDDGKTDHDNSQTGTSSSAGFSRQPVSEDIPVPSTASQPHHHLHPHQKHHHL